MSLILDALRKLEREKEAPGRGFLVMTHVPWARTSSGTRFLTVAVVGLSVAVGVLGVALWRRTLPSAPVPVASMAPPPPAPSPLPAEPAVVAAVAAPLSTALPVPASPPPTPLAIAPTPAPRAPKPATPRPAAVAVVDPAPSPTPAPKKGELHLNAISRQDGQPVALLNDRLVREGDVFDGVRVIHIGESSVEVEVDGRRKTVSF